MRRLQRVTVPPLRRVRRAGRGDPAKRGAAPSVGPELAVTVILPNSAHFEPNGPAATPRLPVQFDGVCKLVLDGVCKPVRQAVCTHRGDIMPRKPPLTPLERAIQQKTDKHARWAARQREAGFKRITVMVHQDDEAAVRAFVADLVAKRRGDK